MSCSTAYTVCPHDCPDTCGCLTAVRDGRVVAFRGDPAHAVTRGWLCAKVNGYLDLVYHPDRLLYPLRRVSPKNSPGRFERITWEQALEEIARRWQEVISRHGAEAILPYSYSGTLGLVQMAVASARLWNRLGASRLLRSICGAAAEHAVKATLGGRFATPYEHVADTRLCIVWGNNPVSTGPHFMPFLREAQRRGCELVVIDPRRTRTARGADLHVAPRPGTDAALALGMAHVIVHEGLHDPAWLAAHTIGYEDLRTRLDEYPPERAAAITGVDAPVIVALARRYASARPALIKMADGINRNLNGGQSVRAICTLPALTGQYGLRGGGLAYSTSDYLNWDSDAVQRTAGCPPPGRVVNMNRLGAALTGEASDPPVMALYVFGANPACIAPNAGLIARGLRRPDLFTVVHELFMTDTAMHADIVLPATTQLEHADLHKAYGHALLAYNRPAIAPRGEARSNWDAQRAIAEAMSIATPALRQDADTVIDEVLAATAAHNPRLAGITPELLRREGVVALTLPHGGVPFAGGHFTTPSGRVELRCDALETHGMDPLPGWRDVADAAPSPAGCAPHDALELVSPAAHHFVSSSFANRADLARREGAPRVEINPVDARRLDVRTGERVRVFNTRGWCELRAVVTDDVRPGVAASPKGWWRTAGGGRNINWTTPDALGDLAGQSTFHSNRVWIEKADTAAPATEPGA